MSQADASHCLLADLHASRDVSLSKVVTKQEALLGSCLLYAVAGPVGHCRRSPCGAMPAETSEKKLSSRPGLQVSSCVPQQVVVYVLAQDQPEISAQKGAHRFSELYMHTKAFSRAFTVSCSAQRFQCVLTSFARLLEPFFSQPRLGNPLV